MQFTKNEVSDVLKTITAETLPAVHLTANQIRDYLKNHRDQKQQFGQRVLYSSKENIGKKGFIINDQATLINVSNDYTHWSNNSYFSLNKDNLDTSDKKIKAVKTVVVDIDCKDYQDALYQFGTQIEGNLNINDDIKPFYVLVTKKGLQVGYVFKRPIFIGKNYEKQLYSINQIYQNIANVLKTRFKDILIDTKNTAFGVQRLPNQSNLISINDDLIDFSKAQKWSMKQSGVMVTGLKNTKKFIPKTILGGANRQVKNSWYVKMTSDEQLRKVDRQGARNTLFTTLTLANKNSNVAQIDCENEMQKFNSKTAYPLQPREIAKIVGSIYRGNQKGAQNAFINEIITTYGLDIELKNETKSATDSGRRIHKRMTKEHRTLLHMNERVDDLIKSMNGADKAQFTLSELEKALGYKRYGLNKANLQKLKKDVRINVRKVKGGKFNIKVEKTLINVDSSKAG